MVCQQCGRQIAPGDRFCNGCGVNLADTPPVDDPASAGTDQPDVSGPEPDDTTASIAAVGAADAPADAGNEARSSAPGGGWDGDDPVWAITGAVPVQDAPPGGAAARSGAGATRIATGQLPSTEPITEVRMSPIDGGEPSGVIDAPPAAPVSTPYDFAIDESAPPDVPAPTAAPATDVLPEVVATPAPAPVAGRRGFRWSPMLVIGVLAGIVTLLGLFAEVLEITSDVELTVDRELAPTFRTGTWLVDDLADNLSIAGLVAVLGMVLGGVAASFGWRWGSGLAGGAGLATTGLAAVTLGLAQMPIDVAYDFAAVPADEPFTLTITRGLGYWLLVVAGALGIVAFFASINDAFGDRRPGLNPWIAALGALAAVIAAVGPLLPESRAVFSDNWYLVEGSGEPPALLIVGRLVQLGLIALGGVIGFLSVRRWGLGLAIGASLPAIWLAGSVLFELTDDPIGPGYRNPGATDMHLHGVTIIGFSALAAMSLLAVIGAYDQGVRERR